jgi:hypothetical protein
MFPGPIVQGRDNPLSTTNAGANEQAGPAAFIYGMSVLDPRTPYTYQTGAGVGAKFYVHAATTIQAVNAVPATMTATNIAAAAVPVAGVAMTLVAASGAGVTVGTSIYSATASATVTGLLALDTAMSGLAFGVDASLNVWDPTKAISRNVRITSAGNDSGGTFTVVGYDIYGYRMTETITGANAGIASGKKAFKYIASVTPAGTLSGSNASVGTGDVFGLPIRSDYFGDCEIIWNNASITANTGYLAAVTTDPATATTGDVRGTYAVQSASDATKRLQIFISPPVANLSTVAGMYGVTQA